MNIKDPGLRRTFEGMMDDGRITTGEARELVESAKDYNTLTTTEQDDLTRILDQLGDRMTAGARRTLETFLGIEPPTTTDPSAPAPQGSMSPLNLTMKALSGQPLDQMSQTRSQAIFAAAGQGGVTRLEETRLKEVYTKYSNRWSPAVREFWRSGLSNLRRPDGGIVRGSGGAAEPEDLSSNLKTVWMQGYDDDVQRAFVEDMVLIAAEKGMKVTLHLDSHISIDEVADDLTYRTGLSLRQLDAVLDVVPSDYSPSVWGEDNRILTDGNDINDPVRVLVPPDIQDSSLTKAMLFSADEGYHPSQPGSFQGAVAERGEGYFSSEIAEHLGREWTTTKCYIEGGNMVPGTTTDGKPYALVGRDSLYISTFHLDETGQLSASKVDSQVRQMETAGAFSSDEVERVARKLAATELAYEHGWIDPYLSQPDLLPSQVNITSADRAEAKRFLAKMELTKEIMGKDVGIPADRLVFIDQPEFHIDMSMRPMGPGEVMVNHPRQNIALIDEALQDPNIRSWERRELQQMRTIAEHELTTHGPMYDKIIDQLEDAGLLVAEAPGVFRSYSRQANFMNAVPGQTPDGESTFISLGSSIKPLERAMERYLEDEFDIDDVIFVGNNYSEDGLTAAEISLEMAGGIDCRESSHAGLDDESKDLLHRYINNL